MSASTVAFPVLRWVSLLWVAVWLPAYVRVWGWPNLLHLCDIAVILGCAGLWWGSSLLISSQAVGSLAAGLFWSIDIGWGLVGGRSLVGGAGEQTAARAPIRPRRRAAFHTRLPLGPPWAL